MYSILLPLKGSTTASIHSSGRTCMQQRLERGGPACNRGQFMSHVEEPSIASIHGGGQICHKKGVSGQTLRHPSEEVEAVRAILTKKSLFRRFLRFVQAFLIALHLHTISNLDLTSTSNTLPTLLPYDFKLQRHSPSGGLSGQPDDLVTNSWQYLWCGRDERNKGGKKWHTCVDAVTVVDLARNGTPVWRAYSSSTRTLHLVE